MIELDPANSHAYHNRGISLDKLGRFAEAVRDFSAVLQLDPGALARPPEYAHRMGDIWQRS